ncbi:hypothetical protein [uncultured Gammaproteobacteria bacterium]|nr:hypothetical protein [uncultured Gammaproteobacteria bacterium]CAC9994458.1 hypothetical protein [uncultured Gammaproteobacteria bacterium]VVH59041.1 hypothetical protein BAZOLSSOX_199 [uncultured Gammaproteobacteria bacterium]
MQVRTQTLKMAIMSGLEQHGGWRWTAKYLKKGGFLLRII